MSAPERRAVERPFDALCGLEVVERTGELMHGRVAVSDRIRQPFGLVHGGVYATLAESLSTLATQEALDAADPPGGVAVGLTSQTSFLRPVLAGHVHALARPRHRGRTTWLWEVECTDDQGRLCALVRMTVAVRGTSA